MEHLSQPPPGLSRLQDAVPNRLKLEPAVRHDDPQVKYLRPDRNQQGRAVWAKWEMPLASRVDTVLMQPLPALPALQLNHHS